MVDYITEVCHGITHIKSVKFSDGTISTKQQVVNKINNGNDVSTKDTAGKTAKVRTFQRGGIDYIRSDRDDTKKDNLGNLPKFSC
jgi:hypothetical protein